MWTRSRDRKSPKKKKKNSPYHVIFTTPCDLYYAYFIMTLYSWLAAKVTVSFQLYHGIVNPKIREWHSKKLLHHVIVNHIFFSFIFTISRDTSCICKSHFFFYITWYIIWLKTTPHHVTVELTFENVYPHSGCLLPRSRPRLMRRGECARLPVVMTRPSARWIKWWVGRWLGRARRCVCMCACACVCVMGGSLAGQSAQVCVRVRVCVCDGRVGGWAECEMRVFRE